MSKPLEEKTELTKIKKNIKKEDKKKDNEKECDCSYPILKDKKTVLFLVLGIVIVLLIGVFVGYMDFFNLFLSKEKTADRVVQENVQRPTKTEMANELKTFISSYLINEGQKIELVNIEEVSELYRINFELDDRPVKLYMTKDGKLLIFGDGVRNFVEFKAEIQTREERNREEREWREKSDQFQAALTPERKIKIAQCLTEKGFSVYVAEWCPFCRQQKELFGEAAKYLTSIDCFDPDGTERNIAKCPNIQGVPAWKDGEGNMLQGGMLDIKRLVQLSDCNY